MRTLRSRLALFSRGEEPDEAERRLKSWGSQMELAEEFERGVHLSATRADFGGVEPAWVCVDAPVDETFANYLVTGQAPTPKAPVLPSKPLKVTSRLNGRAYAAVNYVNTSSSTAPTTPGKPTVNITVA
ncbi:hypothetical protein DPX16_12551 [Anabarilius grahami]|uniref:Uncharacterized protein n=1 Tax=Anabarilius grahami TaxID=495550 RepID=A0A3N0YLI5_ANAGA|nr:hypothetical protein DPX16_12551 [Anabarilius grahami]